MYMKKLFHIKKRGFTLIELLAVIVILAIILLIAMPIVLNIMSDARKGAFESSGRGLVKTVEGQYMKDRLDGAPGGREYVFHGEEQISGPELEFSGRAPTSGTIIVYANGEIEMAIHDGNWCVTKDRENTDINPAVEYEGVCELPTGGGVVVDSNDDIDYVYDPSSPTLPINASPCTIETDDFTHIVDKRDGNKKYAVTYIWDQCWMAENLSYTTTACLGATWNDTAPFDACDTHSTDWGTEVLYQWGAAMNDVTTEGAQGLCPEGWYIPTDADFKQLAGNTDSVYGIGDSEWDGTGWLGSDIGFRLRDVTNWLSGNDSEGFSAVPAGVKDSFGVVDILVGEGTGFTTSTQEAASEEAWMYSLLDSEEQDSDDKIGRSHHLMAQGYSIRCIQN